MSFNEIKNLFNDEWINKLCDDLITNNDFVQRNRIKILESLLVAIQNSIDLAVPIFREQRKAYLFIADQIEKELEKQFVI